MAVLIDPPLWPAHGRRWSHLASDASLRELHAFAAGLGIPERGFEGDHYDVPEDRYADTVAAGAIPVSSRELLRRLQGSGLRRPKRRGERVLASRTLRGTRPVRPGEADEAAAGRPDGPDGPADRPVVGHDRAADGSDDGSDDSSDDSSDDTVDDTLDVPLDDSLGNALADALDAPVDAGTYRGVGSLRIATRRSGPAYGPDDVRLDAMLSALPPIGPVRAVHAVVVAGHHLLVLPDDVGYRLPAHALVPAEEDPVTSAQSLVVALVGGVVPRQLAAATQVGYLRRVAALRGSVLDNEVVLRFTLDTAARPTPTGGAEWVLAQHAVPLLAGEVGPLVAGAAYRPPERAAGHVALPDDADG